MLERPNRRDWKSRRGAISSWVQIPSSPPTILIPYHPECSNYVSLTPYMSAC